MLTVVTPAESQNLASLAEVKAALGIAGAAEDTSLPALIARASAAIATYCNRVFIKEDVEETFRTHRRDLVLLTERFPVAEVASVIENGTAVAPADREFDTASGCFNRLNGNQIATWAQGTVLIAYTAGYAPDAVPPDLEQACIMLVQQYRSQGNRDPMLRAEETTDIERLEYFPATTAGLPAPVLALIEPHRKQAGA